MLFPENFQLIVTLGSRGARFEYDVFPPSSAKKVFDVCGAGDTFLCGLVIGNILFGDLSKSIALANHCAGIAVEHSGTYQISADDILEHLNEI